jgi:hypothetical protein
VHKPLKGPIRRSGAGPRLDSYGSFANDHIFHSSKYCKRQPMSAEVLSFEKKFRSYGENKETPLNMSLVLIGDENCVYAH